jgi:hypothetical protein
MSIPPEILKATQLLKSAGENEDVCKVPRLVTHLLGQGVPEDQLVAICVAVAMQVAMLHRSDAEALKMIANLGTTSLHIFHEDKPSSEKH